MKNYNNCKVAIVHDWLVTYAGAERVLECILDVFPEADLFSVVDFIDNDKRGFLRQKQAKTTFVQRLPFARKHYRNYLALMPVAIEQLDLSGYDMVLSSSHAVAKGVLTGPDQVHVSYVHSPIRYAWDLQHQYLEESGLQKGLKSLVARLILHYIRLWDVRTAHGVDHFLANSEFIARRIWKTYRRKSEVVYPPVDTDYFALQADKQDYYFTSSRMVPYKKMPLIVKAFSAMPDKKLVVIGDGPELAECRKVADRNVELLGWQPIQVLRDRYQQARAYVFAAEEDFGISPLEAQSAGTPVIAFGKGGALETVVGYGNPSPTGVFFPEQSVVSIVEAVEFFEEHRHAFDCHACRNNAMRFSKNLFLENFRSAVAHAVEQRYRATGRGRPYSI